MTKTALITGTTSGIGKAFAEKLAMEKYDLILVSRNEEKLSAQAKQLTNKYGIKVFEVPMNLSEEYSAQKVFDIVKKDVDTIQVLINNAGFDEYGDFLSTDFEKEMDMIRLHIMFTTEMMKLFLPAMVDNQYGRILNLGSIASYIPCPYDAVYGATKAYVLSASKAINTEMKKHNVSVTTLCPGATKTEFADKANMQETLLFKIGVMEPEQVAKIGYRALMKKKPVIVPGFYNKTIVFLSKILPGGALSWGANLMLKSEK